MRRLLSLLKKVQDSSFGKNVVLIAGGTAFAQVVGAVLSPLITRIYPPEQYGILTVFTAILGILTISSSLDYQNAIPIAEDEDDAINLFTLSVLVLLIVIFVIALSLLLFDKSFLEIFDGQDLLSYKYFIPIGVFLSGIYQIAIQWGLRKRNYKVISRTKVSQSLASNFTKIILGLIGFGPVGLIFGVIIGNSAGITSLVSPIIKKERVLLSNIKFKRLKKVARRYVKFPIFSAPNNFVNTITNSIPALLLTSLFGPSSAGFYGLANTVTHIPMSLIGSSISQVFYSEAAYLGKNEPLKIKKLAKELIKKIAVIALIPLVILFITAPWLFAFVFGGEWYEAGKYSSLLSVMIYFSFVLTPVNRILEIFERQRDALILNIIRFCMIFVIFIVAKVVNLNSFQTVGLYSLVNSFIYIIMLLWINKVLDMEIEKTNRKGN